MFDYKRLFQEQSESWALASDNYHALSKIVFKDFQLDGSRIRLQFNPGRMVSSSANVSKEAVKARPCFLCAENRPIEQDFLTFEGDSESMSFQILVNPFPVFPEHFTIAASKHQPQSMDGQFDAMLKLAKNMDDCVLFYNGPRCGASAPDHLHFQAGNKGLMPIDTDFDQLRKTSVWKSQNSELSKIVGFLRNGWVLEGSDGVELVKTFELLLDILKNFHADSNEEPMINLLCWYANGKWISIFFPRRSHRPKCYFKEDESRLLISPASVEMGGLMISARKEDFDRIGEKEIREIYKDVSASESEIDPISELFKVKMNAQL